MAKLLSYFLVSLACAAVLVAAQSKQSESQAQGASSDKFVLHIWRDKQTCEGEPTLPLTLLNQPYKCQVVLKDFFWAKGSCKGDKLSGQVCTDAQCSSCFPISDVAPQNECTFNEMLGGAYKYTCQATSENITKTKEAPKPSAEVNRTIAKEVKQKIPESQQGAQTSEYVMDQHKAPEKTLPSLKKTDKKEDKLIRSDLVKPKRADETMTRKDDLLAKDRVNAFQQNNESKKTDQKQQDQKNQTQQKQQQQQPQQQQQGQQQKRGGQQSGAVEVSTLFALVAPMAAVFAL